uniref:Uncharacterized protein n=1 Tax=Kalanchoe fedtschenkoi TaxID=63787 RepID=A0A7N0UBL8_KALFE
MLKNRQRTQEQTKKTIARSIHTEQNLTIKSVLRQIAEKNCKEEALIYRIASSDTMKAM